MDSNPTRRDWFLGQAAQSCSDHDQMLLHERSVTQAFRAVSSTSRQRRALITEVGGAAIAGCLETATS